MAAGGLFAWLLDGAGRTKSWTMRRAVLDAGRMVFNPVLVTLRDIQIFSCLCASPMQQGKLPRYDKVWTVPIQDGERNHYRCATRNQQIYWRAKSKYQLCATIRTR